MLIQEAFQRCLNVTASTAGHQGYAPAQPYRQNAFGILGKDNDDNNKESIANTNATQVAALTYQSQLVQTMAANNSQHQEKQMAQITDVQGAAHKTLQHIIAGMNGLAFNVSDAGCGRRYVGQGYGGRSCRCGRPQGHSQGPPAYVGGYPQGGGFPQGGVFHPIMGTGGGLSEGFQVGPASGPPPYQVP
jgi:hypothetical protein